MISDLQVNKRKGKRPFSTEQAVKSLTSLGMDFKHAYDFILSLRNKLLNENHAEIDVLDLEKRIEQELSETPFKDIARRYRKFRDVKSSGKPIIIFIAGATGCGKSTLATDLAYRFRINRVLSTDVVRSIMRAMISPELMPSIHKSSFEAWKTNPFPFSDKVDPVLVSFFDQSTRVSVAVDAMIDRVIKENLNMIMEGVHLLPGIYEKFRKMDGIYFNQILVAVDNEEQHRARFIKRGRNVKSRAGKRYLDNFEAIRKIQDYTIEEANHWGLKIFNQMEFDDLSNAAATFIIDQW